MGEISALIKLLNWTTGDQRSGVAEIVDVELICVRWAISAPLSENKSTVHETICDVRDGLAVKGSLNALVMSVGN